MWRVQSLGPGEGNQEEPPPAWTVPCRLRWMSGLQHVASFAFFGGSFRAVPGSEAPRRLARPAGCLQCKHDPEPHESRMPPRCSSVRSCQTCVRHRRDPGELSSTQQCGPALTLTHSVLKGGWGVGVGSRCCSVIAVWKVCLSLLIPSLAKLGVFYALTHFGMEKHEGKKKR